MACEKAGTASFLGYPVTLLFITKVLNCFICKDCDKLSSKKKTNTRIVCTCMVSHSVVLVAE